MAATSQRSLFDGSDLIDPPARARTSDPETSHAAAERHERTGVAASRRLLIEKEVTLRPGQTYREIARAVGLDPVETMRRLNDLELRRIVAKGPVRECTVSTIKSRCSTWQPV